MPTMDGLVTKIVGFGAIGFGVALNCLVLIAAVDGFAAIGFFDIAIGGMILTFGVQAVKFGYDVAIGRQTITGEYITDQYPTDQYGTGRHATR
jgi:hypothetical protein